MTAFQPKEELSRRDIIFDAKRDHPTGVLIPYHEFPFPREIVIGLRTAVSKRFEREQQRTVVCVKGKGWKILAGADQVEIATRTRRHGLRRLGRALQIIKTTDRRDLTAEEQLRADTELIATTTAYGVVRGLSSKRFGVEDVKRWREEQVG